jgi:hypothetical protein
MKIRGRVWSALCGAICFIGLSGPSFAGGNFTQFQYASQPGEPSDFEVPNNTFPCTLAGGGVPVPGCQNRTTDPGQAYNACNQTAALAPTGDGCPVDFYCAQAFSGGGFCTDIPLNDFSFDPGSPSGESPGTVFGFTFEIQGVSLDFHLQMVKPIKIGPHAYGPPRVKTIASVIDGGHTLRTTFLTSAPAGAQAGQGVALAAILGLMQGLTPAEIAGIVGQRVGIVAPDLQARGGAFDSAQVLAVAAQLQTAVAHTPPDSTDKLNRTLAAYLGASSALGAATFCGVPTDSSGP